MKRILSLISMLVIFCIITASMSIVSFAASPYGTAEDTYAHKGSKGLSYTITSYDKCNGVDATEIANLYDQDISTGLYTATADVSPTLTIDLGSEKLVKRITFLGDGGYTQCKMNQTISYSVDGEIWKSETTAAPTQSKDPAAYEHSIYSSGWAYLNEYTAQFLDQNNINDFNPTGYRPGDCCQCLFWQSLVTRSRHTGAHIGG